jgi:N-acetylmuramoyl-L-alanine amidase
VSPRTATLLLALLLGASSLTEAARAPREIALGGSAREQRAGIDANGRFFLEIRAAKGDGWWRLAEQAGLDAGRWRELSQANGGGRSLRAGGWYRVPPPLWPPGLGERVVTGLFPEDRPDEGGWRHRVTERKTNGRAESPWSLALLFLGDGSSHPELELERKTLRPGDTVSIPADKLLPHLRPRPDVAALRAATGETRAAVDDEVAPAPPPKEAPAFVVEAGTESDDGLLSYETDRLGPHGVYRLKKGETLYSHVVMRFTARLGGKYVNEAALRFAERSGIRDVTSIRVGRKIRIPFGELRPQFLPKGHPRRVEWESGEAESRRLSTVAQRRGLAGVHVLLDAGHGGNDPGALSANVWEDDYAYDIKCRLMALLDDRTHATVHPLVSDDSTGHAPLSRLTKDKDERLLTDPPLQLSKGVSTRTAVHARWLLANDIRRRLAKEGVSDDRLVFLSIHADSLHPSARGAMAYYPASKFRPARYGVPSSVSASGHAFAEARTANQFKMTRTQALQAEGRSRRLGEAIIEAVREDDILVHGFSPVRGYIVRRRAMVPAVLRFNRVPASVLVEAVNLNNKEDQLRLRDPAFRQAFAESILDGLLRYFDGAEPRSGQ